MPDYQTIRMPILTVIEPYATCIIHGPKRVENRNWRPIGLIGKDLAIHAGKSRLILDDLTAMACIEALWPELPSKYPIMGHVIGIVTLTGCVRNMYADKWAHGPWCWLLDNPRPIDPIAVRGKPGIFYHDLSSKEAPCLF